MSEKTKININQATKKQLLSIKGVGVVKAEKVLTYLKTGQAFNSFEQLRLVAGISKKDNPELEKLIYFGALTKTKKFGHLKSQGFNLKLNIEGLSKKLKEPYTLKVVYPSALGNKTWEKAIATNGAVDIRLPLKTAPKEYKSIDLIVLTKEGVLLYNQRHQLHNNDKLDITLIDEVLRSLTIELEKPDFDYSTYKLALSYNITRGTQAAETISQVYTDIGAITELQVDLEHLGELSTLNAALVDNNDVTVQEFEAEWADLSPADTEHRRWAIALEAPANLDYEVMLTVDPNTTNNPYQSHVLEVIYTILGARGAQEYLERFEISPTGSVAVQLNYFGKIETIFLQVRSAGGEIIGVRKIAPEDLTEGQPITIQVPPKVIEDLNELETLPDRPIKTTGRLIDLLGERQYENTQIVFYATTVEEPKEEDFTAVAVARTQGRGYFIFLTPTGTFTQAYAKIGVQNADGELLPTIPVRLEKDVIHKIENGEIVKAEALFFPANLVLAIEPPEELPEEDCDCHNDCNQLGFYEPNRIVDEFSYATVIRTTEPEIQGYTLEDDGTMTLQEVFNFLPNLDKHLDLNSIGLNAADLQLPIRKTILNQFINPKKGLTVVGLKKAIEQTQAQNLLKELKPYKKTLALGRKELNLKQPIDWDEEPTIYQATTIAHGHILRFRQEWLNDGYSIGDLLYSLPLAPGQRKQVAVLDWERRESGAQSSALGYQEQLENTLVRDRDVNEIVQGVISERIRGTSSASNSSIAAGLGLGFIGDSVDALFGISGGTSKANAKAWQNASRQVTMNNLQQIKDATLQAANATRNVRSTVIRTVSQGEQVSANTESVANYNHCHSMTIQYFEVLRHLKIQHRLVGVQECLLIPLMMGTFDFAKILRWRSILTRAISWPPLLKGFDAIERIESDYEGSDLPANRYADSVMLHMDGHLTMRFNFGDPFRDKSASNAVVNSLEQLAQVMIEQQFANGGALKSHLDFIRDLIEQEELKEFNRYEEKKMHFEQKVAPILAELLVDSLQLKIVRPLNGFLQEEDNIIPIDATLSGNFNNGSLQTVHIHLRDNLPVTRRSTIRGLEIALKPDLIEPVLVSLFQALPVGSKVTVHSAHLKYRTKYNNGFLVNKTIRNDLMGLYNKVLSEVVYIDTPLNAEEQKDPRAEDLLLANKLQAYLNEHIEHFHKVIWINMSAQRRFMLLDGIRITDYSEVNVYPGGVVRSVASVVENKIVGIVGNSVIMPVAAGFSLDPILRGQEVDLLSLYQPTTTVEPMRLSLPTKGVFAEAVMGKCNSCEVIDEDRFWRWKDEPIPDNVPPAINALDLGSKHQPINLNVTNLPEATMLNQDAPPALPDPSGMKELAAALQKGDAFRDLTGLAKTQDNAANALDKAYAGVDIEKLSKGLTALKNAHKAGALNKEERAKLVQLMEEDTKRQVEEAKKQSTPKTAMAQDYSAAHGILSKKDFSDEKIDRILGISPKPGSSKNKKEDEEKGDKDTTGGAFMVDLSQNSVDKRSFYPSSHDTSGEIMLEARVTNKNNESLKYEWSSENGKVDFEKDVTTNPVVKCYAKEPGQDRIYLKVVNEKEESIIVSCDIVVPQYFLINTSENSFNQQFFIDSKVYIENKDRLLEKIYYIAIDLLKTANVRLVWDYTHLPVKMKLEKGEVKNVTKINFYNSNPKNRLNVGERHPNKSQETLAAENYNDYINLYPGNLGSDMNSPLPTNVSRRQILEKIKFWRNLQEVNEEYFEIWVDIIGRLIGETLAHEVIHSITAEKDYPDGKEKVLFGHHDPAILNALMNDGADRDFTQRTGIKITDRNNFPKTGSYVDHNKPLSYIIPVTQAIINKHFPVPPVFK